MSVFQPRSWAVHGCNVQNPLLFLVRIDFCYFWILVSVAIFALISDIFSRVGGEFLFMLQWVPEKVHCSAISRNSC